jgi:hypothetical protein
MGTHSRKPIEIEEVKDDGISGSQIFAAALIVGMAGLVLGVLMGQTQERARWVKDADD